MKLITENEKWTLYLVDPDEVFDILGNNNSEGLFCRILKGNFQKATHDLRTLKVCDIKNYITAAKNNNPNEFIIFYRVVENKGDRKLRIRIYDEWVELDEKDILDADRACGSGPCGSQSCPLHGYGQCWQILSKYKRYEFEEVNK